MRAAHLKILDSREIRIPRDTALYQSRGSLRFRSRELIRNDPLADGGVDSYAANIVGSGTSPRWKLKDTERRTRIQELRGDWTDHADFSGTCDLYGLKTLGTRVLIDAGEFLSRFVPSPQFSSLPVPFRIQLIVADHMDDQNQVFIFQFCRPVAEYRLKTAVLSGAIDIPNFFRPPGKYFRIRWRPDSRPWVDLVKDQMAEQVAVRNGFKTKRTIRRTIFQTRFCIFPSITTRPSRSFFRERGS